jgi:hypothetical protein
MNIAPRPPAPTGPRSDDPRLGLLRTGTAPATAPAAQAAQAPQAPQAAHAAQAGTAAPAGAPAAPFLHRRRDGILPVVAGALSVRGTTLTGTGSKADSPPELHPLIGDFLQGLPAGDRERHLGRCPEAVLLSRFVHLAEESRTGRKAGRTFTVGDARKALKGARLTARHVREDGDPRHGDYAPPCRSCARLLEHFGVTAGDPGSPCAFGAGGAPVAGESG